MNKSFTYLNKPRTIALLAISFFIAAIAFDSFYSTKKHIQYQYNHFQKQFIKQQNLMEQELLNIYNNVQTMGIDGAYNKESPKFAELSDENNMFFFVYRNDSMLLWSDNRIAEADMLPAITGQYDFMQLSNGWYYTVAIDSAETKFIGLLLVKNNYNFQNKYLDNSFNNPFNISKEVKIKPISPKEPFLIANSQGQAVFALDFGNSTNLNGINKCVIIFCYLLSFLLIFLLYIKIIHNQKSKLQKVVTVLAGGFLLFFLKYLMGIYKFPAFLYKQFLFQPIQLDFPKIFPSLGDLFLFACILFVIVLHLCKELDLKNQLQKFNKITSSTFAIIAFLLALIYFLFVNKIFEKILFNSQISFEAQELLNIGVFPIFGILAIALLFGSFVIIIDYIFKNLINKNSLFESSTIVILLIIGIILYYLLKVQHIDISVVLLMLLTFSTIFYVRIYKQRPYHYSNIVLMVFVFSMYSIYVIYQVTEKKSLREKKDLATSLAYEHDQIAEYLIGDIGESIESDTTLRMLLLRHKIDYPWLYKYIKKKYFTGYWDKYELQATICRPVDSVLIEPKLLHEHCFDFFSNLMSQNTQEISGTSFYFLKNSNGRISYISAFSFSDKKSKESVNLYLQLDLKMAVEELGYPELLLDEKLTRENRKPEYSFAKYYKNNLLSQSGTFLYSLNARKYTLSDKKYSFFRFGGYDHFFYRPDKENLLIISKPEIKVFDLLIIFSYLFIFFFLVLNLMLLVIEPKKVRFSTYKDFKSKIRLSIIGVLIFSLIGVGSISIYFVVKQYKNKNYETIDEKLQSVYMELESKLGQENTIDFNWNSFEYSNLEELLRKLSNVFYTDINLYDANGRMIASSRPEIFEKGLSGNYMNPEAYFQIAKNNKPEFTIEETIGTFQYSSVYSPFTNDNDKLMAYLNLPYFTRQSALKQEISSLLLTIINFYVLLIMLSVSFAVFVSEQITKPLRYIRERFATIKLGAGVEKILYKNHDEIGDLVEEYNRMVDELERSLGLLAKSERESAWREMAKQIAHEIKNPLTPMKLSIQQLQRAWNDKNENLDVYFSRVTRTLIEQIDNLSKIATEFSDFAKIPKPSFEKINLELLLPGIIDLFAQSGSKFVLQYNKKQQFTVMVDKEQISRVFINLATNAVQAIPEGRHGIIEIILTRTDKEILVTFHDNGSGIPEEMADKLFQPSFTTKSGGMGLGLAISKNIIENSGGQITCNSIQGVGTTFVISLPIS